MSRYLIAGKLYDFSALKQQKINELLQPYLKTTGNILCDCAVARPEVYVSRRGGNYFLVKERYTGDTHQKLCKHHSLTPREAASMSYSADALSRNGEDELIFSLDRPLRRSTTPTLPTASAYLFPSGNIRPLTNKVTELGLLHMLWERGRLHEHNPRHTKISIWPELRKAAYGLKPNALRKLEYGLSDILLLELHDETENQAERNIAKFLSAQEKNQFVLFAIKLKPLDVQALLAAETIAFSLKKYLGVKLTLYPDQSSTFLTRLRRSFKDEISYSENGDELIAFGIAEPHTEKSYGKITSMVLMAVTANHIPFDSSYEKELALELVSRARWFNKPLRYEAARDMQVHPDFVILDTPNPIVLEVYGMSTEDYLIRKKEKRDIYSNDEYPYICWEWDVILCRNLNQWITNNPLPSI